MLFRSMKGPNRFERGAFCSTLFGLAALTILFISALCCAP